MQLELDALIAQASGDASQAMRLLAEATEIEEGLPFEFGPPASLKPPHELLGEVALAAGEHTAALDAFRDDLVIHFRCGDLLRDGFVPPSYGFVPFAVLTENLDPPLPRSGRQHARIGIVTNPTECSRTTRFVQNGGTTRSNDCGGHAKCSALLSALKRDLKVWAPTSHVTIHDADTPLFSVARLALANVSFCGPSTFCLWGALAASHSVMLPWAGVPGIARVVAKVGHSRSQSLRVIASECPIVAPKYVGSWNAAQLSRGPLSKGRELLPCCGLPVNGTDRGARRAAGDACRATSNATCAHAIRCKPGRHS